jgi:hypothetical protein
MNHETPLASTMKSTLSTPKQYGKLKRTTFAQYWERLGCVPPALTQRNAFAVGEAYADRYQFGGTFPEATAHHPVFECFWCLSGDDTDPDGTFVCGFFTLLEFLFVPRAQLEAATESTKS